jgi:hypothetical protein
MYAAIGALSIRRQGVFFDLGMRIWDFELEERTTPALPGHPSFVRRGARSFCANSSAGDVFTIMKKLMLTLVILLFALSAHSQARYNAKNGLLKINGVGLGASYAEVIKRLGKPTRIVNGDADECVGGKQRTVHYPGLKFVMHEDGENNFFVSIFEVTSARWNLSGAKIGMTTAAIKRRFGKADASVVESHNGLPTWYYEFPDVEPGNTHFTFRKGKLVSISSLYLAC